MRLSPSKCIVALLFVLVVCSEAAEFTTSSVRDHFIVRLNKYFSLEARRSELDSILAPFNASTWTLIDRQNPAQLLPSDFELVYLSPSIQQTALDLLQSSARIRSVTPEVKVRRSLQTMDGQRHLLRSAPRQITSVLKADVLWRMGITGKGIKVAIFDTGLSKTHPHFKRIKERTNWTNEKLLDDGVSHGTFVAGVIASSRECLGFAPDAELYIFRVFTNKQVSYTSWFLDAFNYAIHRRVNVLNLSIGGPDFLDRPFVDKVQELTANGVIMVSAIGNDGPLFGTLNNPGDQSDVIGVGGMNFEGQIAKFSSRGMTTWELPEGYGRLKPDIVTYGSQVKGSNLKGGCRTLSGTSVSSPLVAGAVALIMSGVADKLALINPSSMKQALLDGATRLTENNMFEQGHGRLNILNAMNYLTSYSPRVTLSPPYLDFTEDYMWPYSSQSLFHTALPVVVNVTILNGLAASGRIVEAPSWHPYTGRNGHLLEVSIDYSPLLWPWSGWMGVHITVAEAGERFEGIAEGHVSVTVFSGGRNSTTEFPIRVKVIPRPPRQKRILWDQFHSLKYPSGYVPRDNLKIKSDPLDWRGDHPHTNFKDLYNHLRNGGYYVEVLGAPFTCFNASHYGTLLVVDPEEEFFTEEIKKLRTDILRHDLSLIVFADWFNATVMKKIKFFDENTQQWWTPDTGGANLPALNELLDEFDIQLGDTVLEGHFAMGDHGSMYYASGAPLTRFPQRGNASILIERELHDYGAELLTPGEEKRRRKHPAAILGLLQTDASVTRIQSATPNPSPAPLYTPEVGEETDADGSQSFNKRNLLAAIGGRDEDYSDPESKTTPAVAAANTPAPEPRAKSGRIAVYGDSNCLDSTHLEKACFWLLDTLLEYSMTGHISSLLRSLNRSGQIKLPPKDAMPPERLPKNNLHTYSRVLDPQRPHAKRKVPSCQRLVWAEPRAIDLKLPASLHPERPRVDEEEKTSNLLRKLESEKVTLLLDDSDAESPAGWRSKQTSDDVDPTSHVRSHTFAVFLVVLLAALFAGWLKRSKGLTIRRCFSHVINRWS